MLTGSSELPGAVDIVMAGIVTLAEPDAEGLATEVAVMVTVKSLPGGVVGAVYVVAIPLAVVVWEISPHGAKGHDMDQFTPFFAESLVTVAVTCIVPPA
jgi:hypothetical protein